MFIIEKNFVFQKAFFSTIANQFVFQKAFSLKNANESTFSQTFLENAKHKNYFSFYISIFDFFQNVFDQITKRIEKLRIIFDRKFFFEFLIFFFSSLVFESISIFVFQTINMKNKNDKFFNMKSLILLLNLFANMNIDQKKKISQKKKEKWKKILEWKLQKKKFSNEKIKKKIIDNKVCEKEWKS